MEAGDGRAREWDFFVSYTQTDQAWAEWIAWQLEEDKHRVLVQAWDFVPGVNWIQSMHEGITSTQRTLVVLSGAYLESVYGGAEWMAAWAADPSGQGRKLLIARIANCDRPGLLSGLVSVDLFDKTEKDAKASLRKMVADALAGRSKPLQAPPFPSSQRAIRGKASFPGVDTERSAGRSSWTAIVLENRNAPVFVRYKALLQLDETQHTVRFANTWSPILEVDDARVWASADLKKLGAFRFPIRDGATTRMLTFSGTKSTGRGPLFSIQVDGKQMISFYRGIATVA